ncbi:hypothetical protein BDF14DRAFT_1722613 [Spinellus fusiger]|nr:hypothetical protein BDF14DRAFT_1722613 [Spinellus fusiger]
MSQFYQEMHEDYKKLLRNVPDMVETVWRWDSALYDTIIVQTFPSIAAPMPTKMHQGLSQFSYGLIQRLEFYLEGFSRHLYQRKTEVARIFASKLNRHLSLNRMAQATSTVLSQPDAVDRLRIDWEGMDFGNVADQGLWTCDCNTAEIQKIRKRPGSLLHTHTHFSDSC